MCLDICAILSTCARTYLELQTPAILKIIQFDYLILHYGQYLLPSISTITIIFEYFDIAVGVFTGSLSKLHRVPKCVCVVKTTINKEIYRPLRKISML